MFLLVILFIESRKPLQEKGLRTYRWKENQGKVERFSCLGGKKIRAGWKGFHGKGETVSGEGGREFRGRRKDFHG